MTDTEQIVIVPRRATPAEHRALASSVGWEDHFDWPTLPASLRASLHGVVAIAAGEVVGMGRVVGDGVHYFYLQDIIVRPDAHDSGIGSTILEHLLHWVSRTAPSRAFVGLFASEEAIGMYERHEFGTAGMTGMHRFVEPAHPAGSAA